MRGHTAKAQSSNDLAEVITQTKRLWRKAHLNYDQTKYVVEQVRRQLHLDPPRTRQRSVERLDMAEVERLIQSRYQAQSKYGLMIKTLFFTGARVEEFVNIRVEDLHFESDPPQVHITHAKGQGSRYVPVLPSLAQELLTHLQGRRHGYLFESNRHTRYSKRTVQAIMKASALSAGITKRVYPHLLRHFISQGTYTPNSSTALHRRNVLAALVAVGCNIGPQRMALASPGLNLRDISAVADWCFSEEALKAAVIDLVNYAVGLPLTQLYGSGNTCSADGRRFYVPVNVLAADYSPLLHARGVTMLTHTADNYLQFYQQAVPCKLREATFNLDGLVEHGTELDPKTCYTDTHGYTEVVMATAALLGFELAPRIKDIKDQTLYKMDRRQQYPHLDPLLTGHLRPHLIRQSWDEVVRVIASIRSRVVSPSLILHRLGSYARQNSIYQALAEIGRVYKTIWILRYLDSEQVRRHAGRELNKGEGSHDLSRFLCFGKEGAVRGREFEDQLHTFSCLAVLHNAVVAWNINQITRLVEKLRGEGHSIADRDLAFTAPLVRKHINALGRYHFDMARMKRAVPDSSETP